MDFKRALLQEVPNQGLMDRYQREITPLLKDRYLFAESAHFVLYDFWNEHGGVDENVFAYSNRSGGERAVILYNNVYQGTRGTIHISAASMDKGSGELRQRSLSDALGLWIDDGVFVAYRDPIRNLEYLHRSTDIRKQGLTFDLQGYQYLILRHWRELLSTQERPWDRLHEALRGEGVVSLDHALAKLRFRPVHQALRSVLSADNLAALASAGGELAAPALPVVAEEVPAGPMESEAVEERTAVAADADGIDDSRLNAIFEAADTFYAEALKVLPEGRPKGIVKSAGLAVTDAVGPLSTTDKESEDLQKLVRAITGLPRLEEDFSADWPLKVCELLPCAEQRVRPDMVWAPVLAWSVLTSFPDSHDAVAVFDELDLRSCLAEIFSTVGLQGEDAWRAAARVRVLLAHHGESAAEAIDGERFWADPDVRWLAGVSEASGVTYFNKEQFEELFAWLQLPALLDADANALARIEKRMEHVRDISLQAGYKVREFRGMLVAVLIEPEIVPVVAEAEAESVPVHAPVKPVSKKASGKKKDKK